MPFFTRKPLLETVKGFFRLSTSVFPLQAIAYPPPIGYRSIGPSVGLLHRQLFRNRGCPATATVTMLSGNGTSVIADGHVASTVLRWYGTKS
ncbi:hypothetical protein [Sphingobacterium siyangense]